MTLKDTYSFDVAVANNGFPRMEVTQAFGRVENLRK